MRRKTYYDRDGVVLYNGDCLDVLPDLPRAKLVLTDPPYGVGVAYGLSYDDSRDDYWDWMRERVAAMRKAGRSTIFTHRVAALRELPTDWDWIAVWAKPRSSAHRIGNSPVIPSHEPIFMYDIHGHGDRASDTALNDVISCNTERGYVNVGKNSTDIDHPVPKPVPLFKQLIKAFTRPGDLVVDPFAGTGTTLVAARDLGRMAIGIEIEAKYCEMIAGRLMRPRFAFAPEPPRKIVRKTL